MRRFTNPKYWEIFMMEDWQVDHIKKHYVELTEETRCTTSFLSILYSERILSSEEMQALNSIALTNSQKVARLYRDIQYRTGSYPVVKSALLQTDQARAFEILNRVNEHNFSTLFQNLGKITYRKTDLIGRGRFNVKFFKGKLSEQDNHIAVKVVSLNKSIKLAKVLQEIEFLNYLNGHENIVKYFLTEITDDSALIALEFCEKNLYHLFINDGIESSDEAVNILHQLTNGVAFVHSMNIILADLKLRGILVTYTEDNLIRVKISDFEKACRIPENENKVAIEPFVGDEEWMAPELILIQSAVDNSSVTEAKLGLSVDIFVLGCIYYFVLTAGGHPFGILGNQIKNIIKGQPLIIAGDIKLNEEDQVLFADLIKQMVAYEEEKRPTAAFLSSHDVFTKCFIRTNLSIKKPIQKWNKSEAALPTTNTYIRVPNDASIFPETRPNQSDAISSKEISYNKNHLLGKGCYNTKVYRGKFENRNVAVKVVNIEEMDVSLVIQEVDFMIFLDRHENIVRYFAREITNAYALIALELCESDLSTLVKNGEVGKIGAMEILYQSAKGISYLHSKSIIHRDLKPANILIAEVEHIGFRVKISDFGMSRKIPDGQSRLEFHSTGVGTDGWIAPEVLRQIYSETETISGFKMGPPADIFSLGCIFYFVITDGKHLFGNPAYRTVNTLQGRPILNESEMLSTIDKPLFAELIRKMVSHDEKDRPTAPATLSHVIFSDTPKSHCVKDKKAILIGVGQYSVGNIMTKWNKSDMFYRFRDQLPQLANDLKIKGESLNQIKKQLLLGTINLFEAIKEIVSEWVTSAATNATLEVLINVLTDNGLALFAQMLEAGVD